MDTDYHYFALRETNLYDCILSSKRAERNDYRTMRITYSRVFILQYAKMRKLKLYDNFFVNFCDIKKFKKLGINTNSLYFAS